MPNQWALQRQPPFPSPRNSARSADFVPIYLAQRDQTQPDTVKSKRILLVEDDLSTVNALRQLLTACGYQVMTAGTVAAALGAVDDSFSAVILDLMLPDGDGTDVLRKVRSSGYKTRVCVTTGVSNPTWLGRVSALGADCILRKPIDLSELLEKL